MRYNEADSTDYVALKGTGFMLQEMRRQMLLDAKMKEQMLMEQAQAERREAEAAAAMLAATCFGKPAAGRCGAAACFGTAAQPGGCFGAAVEGGVSGFAAALHQHHAHHQQQQQHHHQQQQQQLYQVRLMNPWTLQEIGHAAACWMPCLQSLNFPSHSRIFHVQLQSAHASH
jgi:hypothetical protein